MVELKVTIPEVLHARPAALLVAVAKRFRSRMQVGYGSVFVAIESIIGLMSLRAPAGGTLTVRAEGEDELQAALAAVQQLAEPYGEKGLRE